MKHVTNDNLLNRLELNGTKSRVLLFFHIFSGKSIVVFSVTIFSIKTNPESTHFALGAAYDDGVKCKINQSLVRQILCCRETRPGHTENQQCKL